MECRTGLGGRDLSGHVKWQKHGECASLPYSAADFDAAVMIFYDAVGERKAKTCRRPVVKKGRKMFGQVLGRDATTGVADHHAGAIVPRTISTCTVPAPSIAWTAFRRRFRST